MAYRRYRHIPVLSTYQILALLYLSLATLVLYLFNQSWQTNLILLLILATLSALAILTTAVFISRRRTAKLRHLGFFDIDKMSGIAFERYVGELLKNRGYSIRYTPESHDFGIDIVATRDHLHYAIQVKRLSSPTAINAVYAAVAGKSHYHCDFAMVITSTTFTSPAKTLARSNNCLLVDRRELTNWILAFKENS